MGRRNAASPKEDRTRTETRARASRGLEIERAISRVLPPESARPFALGAKGLGHCVYLGSFKSHERNPAEYLQEPLRAGPRRLTVV